MLIAYVLFYTSRCVVLFLHVLLHLLQESSRTASGGPQENSPLLRTVQTPLCNTRRLCAPQDAPATVLSSQRRALPRMTQTPPRHPPLQHSSGFSRNRAFAPRRTLTRRHRLQKECFCARLCAARVLLLKAVSHAFPSPFHGPGALTQNTRRNIRRVFVLKGIFSEPGAQVLLCPPRKSAADSVF